MKLTHYICVGERNRERQLSSSYWLYLMDLLLARTQAENKVEEMEIGSWAFLAELSLSWARVLDE